MAGDRASAAAVWARAEAQADRGALESRLELALRAAGIEHLREHRLPGREFRWDFAFPEARLMVEVQGGIWRAKGAHNTGAAITRDCEKAAYAAMHGWRTFGVTAAQIKSGEAVQWIAAAIGAKAC